MSDMDCDVSVTCLSHTCQQKWSNIDSSHGAYPCQTQQTDSLVWSVKIVFFSTLENFDERYNFFFNRPLMDSVHMLLIEIVHSKMNMFLSDMRWCFFLDFNSRFGRNFCTMTTILLFFIFPYSFFSRICLVGADYYYSVTHK